MHLQFSDIQGRDAGKTGFVLGLGPSLSNHLHDLMLITNDKQKYKIVSCNNIDRLTELAYDYWVLAQPAEDQSTYCIKNAFNRYNSRPNTTLLYTDCLDLTDRTTVDKFLNVDYIGFDQRHFKGMPCTWGSGTNGRHICCEHIIPERLCIQEVLQQVTKSKIHYSTGDTVGVHMLATAIISGMNPIYITGIDLDYTNGYVHNNLPDSPERIASGMASINSNPGLVKDILKDFTIIRDMAKNIGVEIYCLDKGLKLSEVFPYRPFPITGNAVINNPEMLINLPFLSSPQNLIPGGTLIGSGGINVNDAAGAFAVTNTTETNPGTGITTVVVNAENLKDIPATYTGKFKPNDEYDWTQYPGEYAKQLEEIKVNDGQEFFITDFGGSISATDINNHEQLIVFKNNLHNNWKEVYHNAFQLNPKSVFEVGVGGGYQIKNIKKILPETEVFACDITTGQIEKARVFSELSEEQMKNIRLLDFTTWFPVDRQYEFVFSHAVIMHQGTANAIAMLRNMARISSKYILLVEGVNNHDQWYEMVKAVLPDWDFKLTSAYIDYGILLTKSTEVDNTPTENNSSNIDQAGKIIRGQEDTAVHGVEAIVSITPTDNELEQMAGRLDRTPKYNFEGRMLTAKEILKLINELEAEPVKKEEINLGDFLTDETDFVEPVPLVKENTELVGEIIDKKPSDDIPIIQGGDNHMHDEDMPQNKKQIVKGDINNYYPPGVRKKGKHHKQGGEVYYEKRAEPQIDALEKEAEIPVTAIGDSIKAEEPVFVFTEIIGCAEVGKIALESFHKHHDHKVHIYTTEQDIKDLGDIGNHPNNVFIVVSQQVVDLFNQGHAGTAYLFAEVFTGKIDPEIDIVIHFDSDVYFKKESLSGMKTLFGVGHDIAGTRRCYVHNPADIPVEIGTPDTVSTYFFGMRRSVVPKNYSFEQLTNMFLGHNIDLDHDVFDFADCVVFHALKGGAKIYFLPPELFGGQTPLGSKRTPNPANLHIDAGDYLVHFGGAGSGCVCFHNPAGKNESYGKWAVTRYKLFCQLFYDKDIPVDAGETEFDSKGRWVSGNYNQEILILIKLSIE